jgi:uncharacterized protein (TIGR02147 family)
MKKTGKKQKKPDIYSFFDYREYLSDLFDYNKKINPVFSHRYIILRAGFKSPNMLKRVIDKKKNLTLESAEKFADAFKLDEHEKQYFLAMARFNLAESLKEKEKFLIELMKIRQYDIPARIDDEYFDIFVNWWNLAVREIVALPDYKHSSKWIARILEPEISIEEAEQSLKLLKKLGFIKKKKGNWTPVSKTIKTDAQVRSVKVAQYHREMIRLGGESITRFPSDQREISGTTLRIAQKDVPKFKSLLREFRKQLLGLAEASKKADQIYQLNFQFFPIVKSKRPLRLKKKGEN